MYFANVNNVEDQEDLLKSILETKNKIRTQRERKRLEKEKLNLKYGMLVNPITKQIESIIKPVKTDVTPTVDLPTEADPPELNEPTQVENVTATNSSEVLQPFNKESGYQKALETIDEENHDEGYLGINPETNKINGMPFSAEGDTLTVSTDNGEVQIPKIKADTWKILLAKHPERLQNVALRQKNSNLPSPALKQYISIAKRLDLLNRTEERIGDEAPEEIIQTNKYKILSKSRPKSYAPYAKNVEIIPSDKEGLLEKLKILAATYRAGKKEALSSIVPMYQEARRLGIKPKELKFLEDIPLSQVLR